MQEEEILTAKTTRKGRCADFTQEIEPVEGLSEGKRKLNVYVS